jgi:hypothetical protein
MCQCLMLILNVRMCSVLTFDDDELVTAFKILSTICIFW